MNLAADFGERESSGGKKDGWGVEERKV